MTGDFDIASGDVRVRVEGLSKALRALSQAGADAQDMKDLMHAIGTTIISASTPPSRSGRLKGSLRAGRGKTKAVVRAGGARVPYAGVIHYGWPARNIKPNPFLTRALDSKRSTALQQLDRGLADILTKHNL